MCEREWNQRLRGKTSLRWPFCVNAAVAGRERVENAGSGSGGGRTLRCGVRQGSALRFDRCAALARPGLPPPLRVLVSHEEHLLERTEGNDGGSAIGFSAVLDGEDFDGVAQVMEADAIVADAEAQFGRLHILGGVLRHLRRRPHSGRWRGGCVVGWPGR
jgi:hypothetical protein